MYFVSKNTGPFIFHVHIANPTLVFEISKGIMHYVEILCNTVSVTDFVNDKSPLNTSS